MLQRKLTRKIKFVLKSVYFIFLSFIDRFCIFLPRKRQKDTPEKVLFVRLDAIGDFILWLDAAKEIRRLFPSDQYEITLLGNCVWTPFAETLSYFDKVWPLDRRSFLYNPVYRLRLLKKIRSAGFIKIIQPTLSREFFFGDSILRMSGAEERIGSAGDLSNIKPQQKRISDKWYTILISAAEAPLMELKRNAEFMRGIGLKDFLANVPELPAYGTAPADLQGKDYYILFPGAGSSNRRWPLSNFKKLSDLIYYTTGWLGVICGGPGEEPLARALGDGKDIPLQNRAGRTSLQDLISIIGGARMLVGNETGAIHIAAAVSTPAVCILGGGHYGRFIPYRIEVKTARPLPQAVINSMDCFGCNWRCIYGISEDEAAPCIAGISVDMVWKAVKKMLDGIS